MPKPDLITVPRETLERALRALRGEPGFVLTAADLGLLERCAAIRVRHDPQKCIVCVHEYATQFPPIVELRYHEEGLEMRIDEGEEQGDRASRLLERRFAVDPLAVDLARRISNTIAPVTAETVAATITALAGALIRIAKKDYR